MSSTGSIRHFAFPHKWQNSFTGSILVRRIFFFVLRSQRDKYKIFPLYSPIYHLFLFINFFYLMSHRSATLSELSVWIGHHWRTNLIPVFLDAALWYLLALLTSVAKLWNCCLLWGGSESCRLVAWPSSPSPWSPGDFGVFPPGHETALKSADDDDDEDDDEGFLPKTGDGQAGLWDR